MMVVDPTQKYFNNLFYDSAIPVLILDPDSGKIIIANLAAEKFYGWSTDQLSRMNINQINTLSPEQISKEMRVAREQKRSFFKFNHRLKSGEIRNVEVFSKKINISGKAHLHSTIHDITESIKAETELKISEERFRAMIEGAPDPIFIQTNHRFAYLNKRAVMLFGAKSENEILGTPVMERFHPYYHDKIIRRIKTLNEDKKEVLKPLEQKFIRLDGSEVWVETTGEPIFYKGLHGALVFARDISDRKKLEESYKKSLSFNNALIESTPLATFSADRQGNVLTWNRASEKIFGWKAHEVIGKKLPTIPPEKKQEFEDHLNTINKKESISKKEVIRLRKNGERFYGRLFTVPIFDNSGEAIAIMANIEDITEQKLAQQKLILLSRAVEQSPDSVLITNRKGTIEFCNPALLRISGYSKEEVIGETPRIFSSGNKTKKEYQQLWHTITTGKVWEGEFLNKKKNGDSYWESTTISPIINSYGEITHYLAIRKDITHQKKINQELIEAKEQAEESDRLKSAFLSNMSHEIRTPMNSIMGFASLLPEEESKELIMQYGKIIYQNSEQLVNIIDGIIMYSKLQTRQFTYNPTHFNINKLFDDLSGAFEISETPRDVSLLIEKQGNEDLTIFTDHEKLRQILYNLIANAFKYTHKGTIKAGYYLHEDDITFYVSDCGIGIPQHDLPHIFERFYRGGNINEATVRGTGIGLSIVKELVDLLGGNIWAESEEGKGSTLFVNTKLNR
ncbi:MAG: PAS domain-containing sensor histidine kinase [Prolixibacteraceae bacterium]|jgi:PAS domain S-box-containing protein|nr:PAS domain-containing sensor histidine kinase [Prolixibacteraceae bacterium]